MIHEPIKTGLVGFGMSGRIFHAPFLHAHPGFNFSAVTERSQKKVQKIYPQVKSYNSAEEMINDPELELIIINTPNDTHFDYARDSLLAGKHVLIEKPFATSVAEAKQLFAFAKTHHRYVMAYQNRRWDSDFQSVKKIVESKRLGKLIEVHIRFDRYRPLIESKLFKELPIPGSGLAFNMGPHLLDQAISLFGKPKQFRKTTGVNRTGSKVDDYVFFHLMYPNDFNVFIYTSLLVAKSLPAFVIHGVNGTYIKDRTDVQEKQLDEGMSPYDESYGIENNGDEGELTLMDVNNKKTSFNVPSEKGNYGYLFDAVYEQIRNNQSYPINEQEILCQLEIIGGNNFLEER
jgi:predicted dehydrogenase